jgi:hypothetical protein
MDKLAEIWAESNRDVLAHVKFRCDLFFSAELHDQVLITRLSLSDRIAETELTVGMSHSDQQ